MVQIALPCFPVCDYHMVLITTYASNEELKELKASGFKFAFAYFEGIWIPMYRSIRTKTRSHFVFH